jgi:hypothetical protein
MIIQMLNKSIWTWSYFWEIAVLDTDPCLETMRVAYSYNLDFLYYGKVLCCQKLASADLVIASPEPVATAEIVPLANSYKLLLLWIFPATALVANFVIFAGYVEFLVANYPAFATIADVEFQYILIILKKKQFTRITYKSDNEKH